MRYIALTLGPIVDTISLGRKTAEIWAGSYLFSRFMKKVIDELKALDDVKFIIPYVDNKDIFEPKDNGVGLFHDRFIFATNSITLKEVDEILQTYKDELAIIIAQTINRDEDSVKAYINQYLQTYLVELKEEFEHPIIDISKILDSVELHKPNLEAKEDYIRLFLNRNLLLKSKMAKESLGNNPSFKSLPEIASQINNSTKKEEDFYKEIEKQDWFKQAYKYIAIVHADGDSLGAYIKAQKDPSVVSRQLFEFDKQAVVDIEAYGALPIFVGGDDLLFFAPVLNKEQTIFDLLDTLSKTFQENMKSKDVTLSFGVSITYYKYPLYEALEQSRDALFAEAKNYPNKNAIALSVRKHSGQSFEVTMGKGEEGYRLFRVLLKSVLIRDLELPHAIQHKLESYEKLFLEIPKSRIEATFENVFNEEIHQTKFEKGLKEIQSLMVEIGVDKGNLKRLFSLLSIIKLLRGDR